MKKIMVSATSSSVGKTTFACGLMRAISNRNKKVQPFKVGPDYIDTEYHFRASKVKSRNLDEFMLPQEEIKYIFEQNSKDKDISIIEGVMGFYDGYGASKDYCSSANISKILKCPVILIIDAKAMAASSAAIVYGFVNLDKDVNISGIILNNVNTESHYNILKSSIEQYCNVKVLGRLPKDEKFTLSSRHLGLTPSFEIGELDEQLDYLSSKIEEYIDVDKILEIAECKSLDYEEKRRDNIKNITSIKLALAYDKAFNFYYKDNLDLLEHMGVKLIKFSPLNDDCVPECDGIYIGGGFPEVFAKELSENKAIRDHIKQLSESGMPIYAECGGLMYLGENVEDMEGNIHQMTGIFEGTSFMKNKLQRFGYCEGTAKFKTTISDENDIVKGHEFHYSVFQSEFKNAYDMKKIMSNGEEKKWQGGYFKNKTLASYLHTHFCSDYNIAINFIKNIEAFRKKD